MLLNVEDSMTYVIVIKALLHIEGKMAESKYGSFKIKMSLNKYKILRRNTTTHMTKGFSFIHSMS